MENDYTKERELLERYNTGLSSDEENLRIDQAFNSFARSAAGLDSIVEEAQLRNKIWNRLPASGEPVRASRRLWPGRALNLTRRVWLALAAAVAAITLGVWLYYTSSISDRHPELVSGSPLANDIAPGKNTATLTLASGKTINLSDAKTGVVIDASKLTYSDGEELSISSESGPRRGGPEVSSETTQFPGSRIMTVSTPRGGTYQVILPDGTKVWLNADSKISFPSQFTGKERKILLSGEAYFEVAKAFVTPATSSSLRDGVNRALRELSGANQSQRVPFIVETAGSGGRPGQQVEVLGTHFNINSYADEAATKTTLLEGSVKVTYTPYQANTPRHPELGSGSPPGKSTMHDLNSKGGDPGLRRDDVGVRNDGGRAEAITLKPGQQASLKGEALQVKEVNAEDAAAWTSGKMRFNNASLEEVLRQLGRWYNVEILYPEGVPKLNFTGGISRNVNASVALDILRDLRVRFEISGKTIIVKK